VLDVAFIVVVAFALGLLSLMVVARLRSSGVSARRVAVLVGELWAVFALWIGVLWAASNRLLPEGGIAGARDLREMVARFSALGIGEKVLILASLVLGLAVFVHFNLMLRAAMQAPGGDKE